MKTHHKQYHSTTFTAMGVALIGSLCCLRPLMFVSLGMGGAWLGTFNALGTYHPYFVSAVALLFSFRFWQLYVQPTRLPNHDQCQGCKSLRFQRKIFWLALVIAMTLLALPWYGFVLTS